MKLLIVEPLAKGHYIALYTRFLVRAASQRGWHIQLLTTKKVKDSDDFKLVQNESSEEIELFLMDDVYRTDKCDSLSLLFQQDKYYRAIKSGFSRIKPDQLPDIVYMINFDHFDKALSLWGSPFGSTAFIGMMMNIKYHQHKMGIGPNSRNDWLYKQLFKRLLRISTLRKVAVIDEVFWEYTKQFSCSEYKKLNFTPDVGELLGDESRSEARESFGFVESNFVILVYGALAKRKGIKELIEAVASLNNSQIVVLIAGRIVDNQIIELMSNPIIQALAKNGQLIESKGFHDERRESKVFRSADAVWLGYVGGARSSSGVLYQAGSIGLPILATKEGLIGWLTQKHGLGIVFDPTNRDEVIEAINQLLLNEELRNDLGAKGYSLAQKHSASNFGNTLCDLIL